MWLFTLSILLQLCQARHPLANVIFLLDKQLEHLRIGRELLLGLFILLKVDAKSKE